MNTVWSEYVQGIMTLYLSRKLRFDDMFFEQYKKTFDLDRSAGMKILEIGCGPGALAESMHRWYPNAHITAIDRDSNFISFAKENIAGVDFREGDAVHLPFGDDSFDVTISNTVQEHVEPAAFWGEQRRVLKPGGIALCLSARRGLHCVAPCLEKTEKEIAFWESLPQSEDELEKFSVCRFPMSEAEIPASMEKNGFTDVTTAYAVIDLTPDAPKYPVEMAELMIEAMRQNDVEAVESVRSGQAGEIISVIHSKYEERLRLYREGIKQWDTSVSVTMIVRGRKGQPSA
ncbi:MAG: class I SAM-dependent methyltransferase [Lachnospiraceae bacterium]|nr:class I SAM-dependent methyltransferase [Lachnospiraceae bacterium]